MTSVRTADGNTIIEEQGGLVLTGDLTGTSWNVARIVVHPSGEAEFHVLSTFAGSTPCGTGTVNFTVEGRGDLPLITGRFVTIDQSDSVPIHANLTLAGVLTPLGPAFTYSGQFQCGSPSAS